MARLAKGILSDFQGKVGTVVGSNWKNVSYMRSLPKRKKNGKQSIAQEEHRAKFRTGIRFIRALSQLLIVSYQDTASTTSRNAALKELMAHSIGGEYPNYSINYGTVLVARGSLKKADNPAVMPGAVGKLFFTWTDMVGLGNGTSSNKAILAAYCPEIGEFMFSVDGATRGDEEATLDVRYFSGKEVHTWISFRSADGKLVADSTYLGTVMVP